MFRDGAWMIGIVAAAALPLAVHQRLSHGASDFVASSAAAALLTDHDAAGDTAAEAALSLIKHSGHRVSRSADGMFYLTASVNGRPIRFLVDTGASVVVLSMRDALAAQVVGEDVHYNGTMRTVNGEARAATVSINQMDIAGQQMDGVEAAIVDRGIDVSLLGQTALARLESLSIEGNQLTLR